MPSHRTFIAIELPSRVKARAADLIARLGPAGAEVNWVKPAQLHLTLKFLGDVRDIDTPDVCRVVKEVARQFDPFEVACRGAGAFPSGREPRTLWIGCGAGADELQRLQAALDTALQTQLGFAREQRSFHPHLTVGRVKHADAASRAELSRLLAEHADFDADLAVVDELVTFASFLERRGPTHDALDHAELGGR